MLTDPIADYLTRVRNALRADHPEVEIPASRLKKEMTRILVEQGYLSGYEVYACGSVRMVEAAVPDFLAHGLGERYCFSDAFTPTRPAPADPAAAAR